MIKNLTKYFENLDAIFRVPRGDDIKDRRRSRIEKSKTVSDTLEKNLSEMSKTKIGVLYQITRRILRRKWRLIENKVNQNFFIE